MLEEYKNQHLVEKYRKQKFFIYNGKQYTTEMLYQDVLKSFEIDNANLDIIADMGHFFFQIFSEKDIKDVSAIAKSYVETMNEAIQSYWGPSAKAEPDFVKRKIKCTCNDGREVYV